MCRRPSRPIARALSTSSARPAGIAELTCSLGYEPDLESALANTTRSKPGAPLHLPRKQSAQLALNGEVHLNASQIAYADGHDVEHLFTTVFLRGLGIPAGKIARGLNEVVTAALTCGFEKELEGESRRGESDGEWQKVM